MVNCVCCSAITRWLQNKTRIKLKIVPTKICCQCTLVAINNQKPIIKTKISTEPLTSDLVFSCMVFTSGRVVYSKAATVLLIKFSKVPGNIPK